MKVYERFKCKKGMRQAESGRGPAEEYRMCEDHMKSFCRLLEFSVKGGMFWELELTRRRDGSLE